MSRTPSDLIAKPKQEKSESQRVHGSDVGHIKAGHASPTMPVIKIIDNDGDMWA
jgi:hypothetical protein